MPDSENNNMEEMQFQFGTPRQEIDEPLHFSREGKTSETLLTQKLEIAEKDKDRKDKRYYSAFKLIIGCLIFLGCIYVIDVIMSAWMNKDMSSVTDGIIEIVKTLLFTLSGYLFARKENGD